jgi:hypothetical protein
LLEFLRREQLGHSLPPALELTHRAVSGAAALGAGDDAHGLAIVQVSYRCDMALLRQAVVH